MNSSKGVGRKAAVLVALVLLSAVVALAQVVWELSPGEAGGSFHSQAFKEAMLVGEAEGELEVVGGGAAGPGSRAAAYGALLEKGPARFAP